MYASVLTHMHMLLLQDENERYFVEASTSLCYDPGL